MDVSWVNLAWFAAGAILGWANGLSVRIHWDRKR